MEKPIFARLWVLLFYGVSAFAGDRIYLLPLVVTDIGNGATERTPLHIRDWQDRFANGSWVQVRDAGGANLALVSTNGLTDASHTIISEDAKCFAFPSDLRSKPDGRQVTALVSILGTYAIPSDFISTSVDFQTIIRKLLGIFVVACRYYGEFHGQNLFDRVPAETESRDLSTAERLKIRTVVDSLKLPFRSTDIDQRMTVKSVMYNAGDSKTDIVPMRGSSQ